MICAILREIVAVPEFWASGVVIPLVVNVLEDRIGWLRHHGVAVDELIWDRTAVAGAFVALELIVVSVLVGVVLWEFDDEIGTL